MERLVLFGSGAMVSISLKNHRKDDLNNISITDSPPEGFKLVGNTTLHWIADIPAGGDWDIHYLVKPLDAELDGVELPPAVAAFTIENQNYSIQSNQPSIKVYGPKIVLTKQTDVSEISPGDIVTVTVVAENTGNTPTKLILNDTLPENAALISGNTTYETFLESNKKASFNYSIRVSAPITLPPANAIYFEPGNKGGEVTIASQGVIINKKAQEVPQPTPEPTPEPTATPTPTTAPGIKESGSISNNNGLNDILNFLFGCDNSSISPAIKGTFCSEENSKEENSNIE